MVCGNETNATHTRMHARTRARMCRTFFNPMPKFPPRKSLFMNPAMNLGWFASSPKHLATFKVLS